MSDFWQKAGAMAGIVVVLGAVGIGKQLLSQTSRPQGTGGVPSSGYTGTAPASGTVAAPANTVPTTTCYGCGGAGSLYCPSCRGAGQCLICNGTGKSSLTNSLGYHMDCDACRGSGRCIGSLGQPHWDGARTCSACNGSGRVTQAQAAEYQRELQAAPKFQSPIDDPNSGFQRNGDASLPYLTK